MFSLSILEILITIIISVVIIYSFQYFWNYLKDTFTTKKTKNIINGQIEKYKRIIDEIQQQNSEKSSQETEFISEKEKQEMSENLMKLII